MSSKQKSDTETTKKPAKFQDDLQKQIDAENEQGFRGTEVDSTPNSAYTVAGVTGGAPTPETDTATAAKVREEGGVGLSALETAQREKDLVGKGAAQTRKAKRGGK